MSTLPGRLSGRLPGRRSGRPRRPGELPSATVARLPLYHRALADLAERGRGTISSGELARIAGVSSAGLRKDLSLLGSYGTRGVGYDVSFLRDRIADALGLTRRIDVVIVGVGNLGHALASYPGFAARGFHVIGLVDSDPTRIGQFVDCAGQQVRVSALAELTALARCAQIDVIATPDHAAQSMCDRVIAAGVRSILNFAPTALVVPPTVAVRNVDLGLELSLLAFHDRIQVEVSPDFPSTEDEFAPHLPTSPQAVGA